MYDEIYKDNRLRHILVRQEGGALHAAEGYARSTGRVGVALVTSGPGATNAVTGLTDALDGQHSRGLHHRPGAYPPDRQRRLSRRRIQWGSPVPCTKHNYLVKDVDDLARVLHEAFYVARTGRPGPVVVDIPKDVQLAIGLVRQSPRTSSTAPIGLG